MPSFINFFKFTKFRISVIIFFAFLWIGEESAVLAIDAVDNYPDDGLGGNPNPPLPVENPEEVANQ